MFCLALPKKSFLTAIQSLSFFLVLTKFPLMNFEQILQGIPMLYLPKELPLLYSLLAP